VEVLLAVQQRAVHVGGDQLDLSVRGGRHARAAAGWPPRIGAAAEWAPRCQAALMYALLVHGRCFFSRAKKKLPSVLQIAGWAVRASLV
jgi:hypothetical protein